VGAQEKRCVRRGYRYVSEAMFMPHTSYERKWVDRRPKLENLSSMGNKPNYKN
jgi:hypothetical protein